MPAPAGRYRRSRRRSKPTPMGRRRRTRPQRTAGRLQGLRQRARRARKKGGRERGRPGGRPHPGPGGRTGWTRFPYLPQPRRSKSNQLGVTLHFFKKQILFRFFSSFFSRGWGYEILVSCEENREEYQNMQYTYTKCPIVGAWVLKCNFMNSFTLIFKTLEDLL
jgi:hypothetical protein